ncbi:MAG: sulfatase activating formylglycine-generating enzyme, partial [Myxococcota bacterium]
QRVLVDHDPVDCSPYGVRGMAGNTRDLCANLWTADGPGLEGGRVVRTAVEPEDEYVSVRGGGWASTARQCRLAGRLVARPGERFSTTGLRLVRST